MAIQAKSGMSETEHDRINAGQFRQAVIYLRNRKAAEMKKRE
jgi:hypothetical protein